MIRVGAAALVIARAMVLLAAAVYFGGMVGLGAVAAPEIFRTLKATEARSAEVDYLGDPRQLGGEVFGNVLGRFRKIEVGATIAIAVGLIAEWVLLGGHRGGRKWRIASALLLVGVAAALLYDVSLTNRVWEARSQWRQGLKSPDADKLKTAFDALHHESETIGHMKVYLLAALLVARAGGGTRMMFETKEPARA